MSGAGETVSGADETVDSAADAASAAPFLRVVRGNPTDEEVAVLVTLIAAAASSGGGDPAPTEPRNDWGRPEDRLRPALGAPGSFTNLHW